MKQHRIAMLALVAIATSAYAFSSTAAEDQEPKQTGIKVGHYLLHGNGTVSDAKTGLMWKQCSEGLSGASCRSGKLGWYTWASALQQAKVANRAGFSGYSDWRLPTIKELQSILEKQRPTKPKIDTDAFPRSATAWYWSASPRLGNRAYVWSVFFGGYTLASPKTEAYCVRLVRDEK